MAPNVSQLILFLKQDYWKKILLSHPMPIKLIDHGSKEYQQMVDLRLQLLRKPLGLSFSDEELVKEKSDFHIGFFEEKKL